MRSRSDRLALVTEMGKRILSQTTGRDACGTGKENGIFRKTRSVILIEETWPPNTSLAGRKVSMWGFTVTLLPDILRYAQNDEE